MKIYSVAVKSKGDEAHEDTGLAAALGVDQFDEPDPQCPWCAADCAEDSDFCHSCGKLRKALTCYNCESHYLKGTLKSQKSHKVHG